MCEALDALAALPVELLCLVISFTARLEGVAFSLPSSRCRHRLTSTQSEASYALPHGHGPSAPLLPAAPQLAQGWAVKQVRRAACRPTNPHTFLWLLLVQRPDCWLPPHPQHSRRFHSFPPTPCTTAQHPTSASLSLPCRISAWLAPAPSTASAPSWTSCWAPPAAPLAAPQRPQRPTPGPLTPCWGPVPTSAAARCAHSMHQHVQHALARSVGAWQYGWCIPEPFCWPAGLLSDSRLPCPALGPCRSAACSARGRPPCSAPASPAGCLAPPTSFQGSEPATSLASVTQRSRLDHALPPAAGPTGPRQPAAWSWAQELKQCAVMAVQLSDCHGPRQYWWLHSPCLARRFRWWGSWAVPF